MDSHIKKRIPHWPSYARALKREAALRAEEGKGFDDLIEKAEGIEDPYYRVHALAWIARRMADTGAESTRVFSKAVDAAKQVTQEWRLAEVLVQVASEMSKAGGGDFKALIDAMDAIHDPYHRRKALEAARRRITKADVDFPEISGTPSRKKRRPPMNASPANKSRSMITLGLLNTYMGKTLKGAHIRALARAAPLCYAYDLNLCLLGFPVADAGDAVSRVERESMTGEGGGYIRRLLDEGRLFVLEVPKEASLPGIGEMVATTSRPDPKKMVQLEKIAKKDRPFCILMGLGSRGLPKGILRLSRHHLELTGKGIPLETCTAMGVLAALLSIR